MKHFHRCFLFWTFVPSAEGPERFVPRRAAMQIEYEDQNISEFISACTKRFCPWCGAPVMENRTGRKKKFCSDKCRWAFWKFETRHKDKKLELEAMVHENR